MTDLIPADQITIAHTAFDALWNMLQDEQGNPLSIEANDALLAIYDNLRAVVSHNQDLAAQLDGMAETLNDLRQQRNELALEVQNTGRRITKITRDEIAHCIGYEMLSDYSNTIAEDLLQVLTGDDDRSISTYTRRRIQESLEAAAEELADLYEDSEINED
jgi:hypothetical protein